MFTGKEDLLVWNSKENTELFPATVTMVHWDSPAQQPVTKEAFTEDE